MPRQDEPLRAQIASATRAVEYARRAANLDETKLETLVDHLHTLAELRVLEGDFSRAESLLREAMFRIKDANENRKLKPRPILAANVASSLGYLYDRWGKADKAREWYASSLEMAEAGGFLRSDLGASVSNNLGMLDKKDGRPAEAEAHYRRSLELFEEFKGKGSPECAAVANNLGVLLYTCSRQDEALALHEQALAVRQLLHNPVTGEGFRDLCQTWQNLAAVYKAKGNVDKAAALLRQAGLTDGPSEATTPNWVIKEIGIAGNVAPPGPPAKTLLPPVEELPPPASLYKIEYYEGDERR